MGEDVEIRSTSQEMKQQLDLSKPYLEKYQAGTCRGEVFHVPIIHLHAAEPTDINQDHGAHDHHDLLLQKHDGSRVLLQTEVDLKTAIPLTEQSLEQTFE